MNSVGYNYDVALSFSGEDRVYVEQVANFLKSHDVKVFYDKYEEIELWGKDLYSHLDDIYRKKAKYCVMFISEAYREKLWTNHERESAQARAFTENEEYILPARFDNTEIPGIKPTTAYINLRGRTPEEFGRMILKKISKESRSIKVKPVEHLRKPKIGKRTFNRYDEAIKFINFIVQELKRRCEPLSDEGLSLTVFDRDSRKCLRIVHSGETKFALDVWMGGMGGDASLNFYVLHGEPHSFSNSTNAWGNIIWDKEKESLSIELFNLSLFRKSNYSSEPQIITYEEFIQTIWDDICDALESET